jgi:oxalate decarboxylase/phosphoglucose isomerase-like protein (cupin superfamily)
MTIQQSPDQSSQDVAAGAEGWPFLGRPPYPRVIHEHEAKFQASGISNDGLNRTPVWFYAYTTTILTGIFSLAPGDYFKPGNHPNPEAYFILDGTIHLGNPDTGQVVEVTKGDVVLIPAFQMHVGYNFGSETCRMLWMIPREGMTDEFRANPVYDDHYMNFRQPIVLHRDPVHRDHEHGGFAQPGFLPDKKPASRHTDLRRWPPANGKSAVHDPDVDNAHLYHRGQWLHFVTGRDFDHQFLTSFAWSTDEFQFGTVKIPPNRITNAIAIGGDRVYWPMSEQSDLIVNIMDTNESLIGRRRDAIYVPGNVAHQFQNPGHEAVEAVFACATAPGTSLN